MKELLQKIKVYLSNKRFYDKLHRQIRKSEKLAYESGRVYYIMNIGGKMKAYSQSGQKLMLYNNQKSFQKGATLETLKRMAIYTTARQFAKNKDKEYERKIERLKKENRNYEL